MTILEQLVSNAYFNHSRHVAQISKIIAAKAGYSETEITIIEQAALLHDVGKSAIPPDILNKPDVLTPEEYELIKTHTENGYHQIMDTISTLASAASVAKEHHERLDGSGYLKLSDDNINPYAKLISIADAFDALISRRVYKEPWDVKNAIQYLAENDNHFDRIIVGYLMSVISEVILIYKSGSVQQSKIPVQGA